MNPAGIDTGALLTMLGLIAAVWAVVPSTSRLSFRLSLNWFDWFVIWGLLIIIHGLFFEPVLITLGFPILGPWLWGFDKSATQYILFLLLAAFVYWRSRRTKLTRWNLGLFDELSTALLHAGKYEELSDLLLRHLDSALDLAAAKGVRNRLAKSIRPQRVTNFRFFYRENETIDLETGASVNPLFRKWFELRESLADMVGPSQRIQRHALQVVRRLLSSRNLTAYLATAHPYFCIQVMERATRFEEQFQDVFFSALLANEASVLYSEINNNENFGQGGHRLHLPEENRLLRFYCVDVDVAARLGVYRSIGESVLVMIDENDALERNLNGRLLTFMAEGRRHNPVYVGIQFFRIMVLEGLHQRVADHLWLHYMPHFADRLVERARELRPYDGDYEFPTPLTFLLYTIVDTTVVWIRDAEALTTPDNIVLPEQNDGDHIYISFEAAEALGRVVKSILISERMSFRFKKDMLRLALSILRDIETHPNLEALSSVIRRHLIEPYGYSENRSYLDILKRCFNAQEQLLRLNLGRFKSDLDAAWRIAV